MVLFTRGFVHRWFISLVILFTGDLFTGGFIHWGFCPLGVSSTGVFARGFFFPLNVLSTGDIVH